MFSLFLSHKISHNSLSSCLRYIPYRFLILPSFVTLVIYLSIIISAILIFYFIFMSTVPSMQPSWSCHTPEKTYLLVLIFLYHIKKLQYFFFIQLHLILCLTCGIKPPSLIKNNPRHLKLSSLHYCHRWLSLLSPYHCRHSTSSFILLCYIIYTVLYLLIKSSMPLKAIQ